MRALNATAAVLAAAMLALAPAPAAAQVDPAKAPAAKKAAAGFMALAKGSEKTGRPPREADPAVKPLLEAVFDARDVAAAKTMPSQAMTPLSERMMAGVQVGLVYMLAGTGATDLTQIGADPAAMQKVNLNVIKFAPEMGRFFDFQMRIQGGVVDAVQARLATARPEDVARPNFQSGLANIRQGSARAVAGVIETLAVNGITEAWRRDRLPALAAMGPRLAKFLAADQKTQLQQLARACADVMDDAQVKQTLLAFAAALGG